MSKRSQRPSLTIHSIRQLPPWLLPGAGLYSGNQSATPSELSMTSWRDKYETDKDLFDARLRRTDEVNNVITPIVLDATHFAHVTAPVIFTAKESDESVAQQQPAAPCSTRHDCSKGGCQRVILNVSGQRYETQLRTLSRFPKTLLGDPLKRSKFWDERRNEFFLDRHRPSFQAILYYYQSGGRLRRPVDVPEDVFLEEIAFYELGERPLREYREKEGYPIEKKQLLPTRAWQRRLWLFCEEPESSKAAKVFAVFSILCIVVSIINFCTETLPKFDRPMCINRTSDGELTFNYQDAFFIVETVTMVWFTTEFFLRLISCPSKLDFAKNIMNIFDLLAIVPFFVTLIVQSRPGNCTDAAKKSGSFVFVRVLRVFRVFKLSKHSQGLRVLGLTIKTSIRELGMFFFFLLVAMVLFSSAVYYAEVGIDSSEVKSIPGAFWWAIVTMTTVGYGDIVPVGVWGKLVGTFCVVAGVLTVALPVPVVVANFNNFYRHESGRGYVSSE